MNYFNVLVVVLCALLQITYAQTYDYSTVTVAASQDDDYTDCAGAELGSTLPIAIVIPCGIALANSWLTGRK